jgi:dephospho-CoA kinase
MKVIAITGSIGSGKTRALQWFREKGLQVISADEIGHDLLERGEIIYRINQSFGNRVVENGKVNRKKLGEIVFSDPEQLETLNQILHPLIIAEIRERIKKSNADLLIFEVPLLFEAGIEDMFDLTINIAAREDIRKRRLQKRDNLTEREIENRFCNQLPDAVKREKADITVDNNEDEESFTESLEGLYTRIFIELLDMKNIH